MWIRLANRYWPMAMRHVAYPSHHPGQTHLNLNSNFRLCTELVNSTEINPLGQILQTWYLWNPTNV
jgi:hypothetical protein